MLIKGSLKIDCEECKIKRNFVSQTGEIRKCMNSKSKFTIRKFRKHG